MSDAVVRVGEVYAYATLRREFTLMKTQEVIPYLLGCKLLGTEAVIEGDLVVFDVSRRNKNFKVITKNGPSYLLKEGMEQNSKRTLTNEAAVYQRLHTGNQSNEIQQFIPRFFKFDPESNCLVLELLVEAQDLWEYHTKNSHFSTTLASKMGAGLAALHSVQFNEAEDNIFSSDTLPWAFTLHRPELNILRDISSANLELIKIIQRFKVLCDLLDSLRKQWRTESLIHGDIKWDNLIVYQKPGSKRKTNIKIIDWEMAGIGDPCWDVGTVFSEYLSCWILSIPVTGETPPEQFPKLAKYPLNRMQPAIRAFWRSYILRMKLDSTAAEQMLLRAVKFGAARLVQTSFEHMYTSVQLTGNIICLLQICLNILQRPEEAIVKLLGIPLKGME